MRKSPFQVHSFQKPLSKWWHLQVVGLALGHPRTQHFPPPPFPPGNRTARRIKAETDLFSVIGIDLGSSSTRAVLRCLDDGRYVHIDGKANPNNAVRYSSGDFASSGYPLEKSNGPYYVPNHEQDEGEPRHDMSLKYGMYVLANASTAEGLGLDLLQQYPLVQEIMATLKDDADFPARLRQDLVELFSEIRGRIYTFCARAGLRITRIGLTIPVQWTLEFEGIYSSMTTWVRAIPSTCQRERSRSRNRCVLLAAAGATCPGLTAVAWPFRCRTPPRNGRG